MIIGQAIPDGLLVCLASRPMFLGGACPRDTAGEGAQGDSLPELLPVGEELQ
ncbi:hypothetical protein [uncultured Porphyromonas sp.]|uniref:hypothetical protein n=1 Tax=uncultured Porphyromonas sp. TaxID=159274 RepID=UPI002627E3EB|nr:hypothetical protein [uncultured Porphyromonas sp.]